MVAVLRLEGLPFKATVDEIDDFFSESDIRVENVHLLLNRDMRPSGTGFVELSESDTKTALQLSGKCIGDTRRYVKIVKSDTDELEWHLRRQQLTRTSRGSDGFFCVRMYGLPFKVKDKYQIACWFGSAADCVDVQIHINQEGRSSGEATAYFTSRDKAKAAMKRNKEDMGGRYVSLSMDSAPATFNTNTTHNAQYCIKMTGIPFRATEKDLRDFFGSANPVRVKIILNRDSRPSGEALADFDSQEDFSRAMSKDHNTMGSRYVVLSREGGGRNDRDRDNDRRRDNDRDRDQRRDMDHRDHRSSRDRDDRRENRRNSDRERDNEHSRDRSHRSERGGFRQDGPFTIKMGGLPYKATVNEIIDWFHPKANCINARILRGRDNRPSGEAVAEFDTEDEARSAMAKNREYMGERFIVLTTQGFKE